MPFLPQIRAQPGLAAQNLPMPRPIGLQISREAQDWADQEEKQQLQTFDINAQTEIRQRLMDLREKLAPVSDPDEYKAGYQQGVEEIRRGAPQAGQYGELQYNFRLNQALNSEADNVAAGMIERRRGAALTNAGNLFDLTVKQAAELTDPVARHERQAQFNIEIDRMPFLHPQEQARLKDKMAHDVDRERGYVMLENNPQSLLDALKDNATATKNFPNLDGSERQTLKEHAQDELSKLKSQAKAAEHERVDEINRDFLEANDAGHLTKGQVLKSPLPFESQRFWIDRLNAQTKSAAKGEPNPFEKSDPATRGFVMRGILTEPEKWDQNRVLSYMGRGLSVGHALQLSRLLTEKNKKTGDLPPSYTPLRRSVDTLEDLRKSFAFVELSPGETITAEIRAKNDREYEKVLDKLQEPLPPGKTHRDVLDEAMKPYYENKARHWYDFLWTPRTPQAAEHAKQFAPGTVTPAERAADDEAKRYLTEGARAMGMQVDLTPENIAKAKKRLEQKKKSTPELQKQLEATQADVAAQAEALRRLKQAREAQPSEPTDY